MDQGRAELGIPHHQGRRDLYNFKPVDPFTSSIAQVTRNRRNISGPENIDDVVLPLHPSGHFHGVPWQTPYATSQLVPSPSTAPTHRRSSRRDHDLGSVHPTVPSTHRTVSSTHWTAPSYPPTPSRPHVREEAVSSNNNSPYGPVPNPQQHADVSVHSSLYDPHIEGDPSANSSNSPRHDSLEYPMSPPLVDTTLRLAPINPPISSSPVSSTSSRNVRFDNQVTWWENVPQQRDYLSSDSFPRSARPASLSQTAVPSAQSRNSYAEQGIPAGSKNHIIPSLSIPQYHVPEHEYSYGLSSPATGAAVPPVKENRPSMLFATDILPRQVYLHFLLRLPSFYFSRVSRIFTEADLTLSEIKEMALQVYTENQSFYNSDLVETGTYYHPGITTLSPAYARLKLAWEYFIDNLIREWKTLNIVSVLLLSAIMSIFQIEGAAEDPVTRYLAFWSLICALMSLLYGCSFIIRFASMRKAYKAVEWAIEAQKTRTNIFWNVWVMLAMPMVWMSWSILTFIASIMSFMWRAKAKLPSDFEFSVAPSTESGFRIFICVVLGMGAVYGILIISTFRRYGTQMDETWTRRVKNFIESTESNLRYRSTTWPTASQDRINFGSMRTLFQRSSIPRSSFHQSHRGDEASIVSNVVEPSSLSYQSQLGMHPQPGIQLAKPSETQELQPRRSKSPPPLSRLIIPDSSNRNEDTNMLPESPEPPLHQSTSTSSRHSLSRHPIPSKNNNTNLLPKLSEPQLRRFTSDNSSCGSLAPHPIPVVNDPNKDTSSPPCPSYDSVSSDCSPLTTRHREE